MELLIKDIRNKSDKKLLTDLLKRLGLSYKELSAQEKEDYASALAYLEKYQSLIYDKVYLELRIKRLRERLTNKPLFKGRRK